MRASDTTFWPAIRLQRACKHLVSSGRLTFGSRLLLKSFAGATGSEEKFIQQLKLRLAASRTSLKTLLNIYKAGLPIGCLRMRRQCQHLCVVEMERLTITTMAMHHTQGGVTLGWASPICA